MYIDRLRPEHADAFRDLRLRALAEAPYAFSTDSEDVRGLPLAWFVDRIRDTGERFVLGAFEGKELVGVVGFAREEGRKTRHRGAVSSVYVAPAWRRQRIAHALMQRTLELAWAMPGLDRVELGVTVGTAADPEGGAPALYLGLGFEVYGLARDALRVDGRSLDEALMVLRRPAL